MQCSLQLHQADGSMVRATRSIPFLRRASNNSTTACHAQPLSTLEKKMVATIYRCQYCLLHLSTTSPHGNDLGTSGNHILATSKQDQATTSAATAQQDQATIHLQNQSRITTATQSANYTKSKPQTHKQTKSQTKL